MVLALLLPKYPVVSLFTPRDNLSLSTVATHFKLFAHVVLQGIFCCYCFRLLRISYEIMRLSCLPVKTVASSF